MFGKFLWLVLLAQAGLAQTTFSCNTTSAFPVLVRAEGLAERVSDVVLTCTGGQAGLGDPAIITVYLGSSPNWWLPQTLVTFNAGTLTSRLLSSQENSEALLIVDELSSTATPGTNVIQGIQTGVNQVTFYNVPIVAPGPYGSLTLRFTNLRADVKDSRDAVLMAAFQFSGTAPVPITNAEVPVAVRAPGTFFALETSQGSAASGLNLQPASQNAALVGNAGATGGSISNLLKFTEGFAQSYRKRNTATSVATPTATADQGVPGTDYHTESGFYLSGLPSTNGLNQAGLATQGTRLMARFNNVPPGVTLYVTTDALPGTGASSAKLTSTDASGAGAYSPVAATTTVASGNSQVGIAPVTLSGGSGTAAWEILDADPNSVESYTFGVVVAYASAQSGTATVVGELGPISTVAAADAAAPVPRFTDTSVNAAACAANPCLTASPAGFALSYQTGMPAPGNLTIQLDTAPEALAYQISVTSLQSGWLAASSAGGNSGTTPDQVTVRLTPGNLPAGVYQGSIVISSPSQKFAAVTVPVVLTVTAASSGAVPLTCTASSAVTPQARAAGMTEIIGDVLVQCTGGTPAASGAAVPVYDVQLTLTTPITSRIYSSGWSEALLMIDDPGNSNWYPIYPQLVCADPSGSCSITGTGTGVKYDGSAGHPNIFVGRIAGNTVTFPAVPIDAPAANGIRVLRITNIRADTTSVDLTAPTPIPGAAALLGTVNAGVLPVANPVNLVAYVGASMTGSIRTPDDSNASGGFALSQCPTAAPVRVGTVRFAGLSGTAFRSRITTSSQWTNPNAAPPLSPQNVPGMIYITESGFYSPSLVSPLVNFGTVGLADSGTRLRAQIANIPAGARVFVSTQSVVFNNGTPSLAGTSQPLVRLIQGETQAFAPVASTNTLDGVPAAELTVSNGTATAVWEVLYAAPNLLSNIDVAVWVLPGNTASASAATVTPSYAPAPPAFADAGGHAPSSILPEPRFEAATAAFPLFSVGGACVALNAVKTHSGVFQQGQNGAAYSVTVGNAAGASPTTGTVTVTENLPSGLTLVSMAGAGWSCSSGACTRSDALNGGASYPPIAVTVNVAANAPSQVTNQVSVTGGGSASTGASDTTVVAPGTCTYSGASLADYPSMPAIGMENITAPAGCAWSAVSSASWLTITANNPGYGNGTVTFSLAGNPNPQSRTATITVGNSVYTIVQDSDQPPTVLSLSPFAGSGDQTFTIAFSDPFGATAIAHAYMLINVQEWVANSCYIDYNVSAGTFSLMNDAGTAWLGPVAPASLTSLSNSQCTVSGGTWGGIGDSSVQSLSFTISFTPSFAGSVPEKRVFLMATDYAGGTSGWMPFGVWYPTPLTSSLITRYRLYFPVTKEHLYTTDLNEYNTLGAEGWNQEGPDASVFNGPATVSGSTTEPMWRLYYTTNMTHLWTTDRNEYLTLMTGYGGLFTGEGADEFLFPNQAPGTIPLYRLLFNGSGPPIHTWTTDPHEFTVLTAPGGGWTSEGITGYLYPPGTATPHAIAPAPQTDGPAIAAVVNGLSRRMEAAAPGQVVSIFGRFGDGAGVRVLMGGRDAEVVSSTAQEVRAIVPKEFGRRRTTVVVVSGGRQSNEAELEMAAAAPAVMASDPYGRGQAVAENEDGSANSAANPAAGGSIVKLKVTGDGGLPVTATVGGYAAEVVSVRRGTQPGLAEVRVRLPLGLAASPNTLVRVKAGEFFSQAGVTLSVR